MNWKEKVGILEKNDDFDVAIFFLERVIKDNSNDVDAYIFLLFRLMDTIVEHQCYFANVSRTPVSDIKSSYYDSKENYYESLAKRYFREGYAKFLQNADFLYYVGFTAAMSEWYFGIDKEDYVNMLNQAMALEPDNLLYRDTYFINLDLTIASNKKEAEEYAKVVLIEDSPLRKAVADKGAVGECWLELATNWSKRILGDDPN